MTVCVNTRDDFTLANARRVMIEGAGVEIGDVARAAMVASRSSFEALLERDQGAFIYGTTTGGGPQARTLIPPEEQEEQTRLRFANRSLGDSFGDRELPARVVRGVVFARLVDLVEGHGKCRPEVAEGIAGILDGPVPPVPLGGETSAGEIVALAHVMAALAESDYRVGEYQSLLNGSPCSTALAVDMALQARTRLALVEHVLALSIEAINAPLEAYHPALKALWRDPYADEALDALNALLAGAAADRRRYQAPVSYRVLPRVLGQGHRVVRQVEEVAATALRAITINPVYVPPDPAHPVGQVLHTGGYHNAAVSPALDAISAMWADLCTICDRQVTKLHKGEVSLLADMLVKPGDYAWGGTALLGFVIVGFAERAGHAAKRTFLPPSEGGGYGGQDDVALPTFLAYERCMEATRCLDACLAILAVVASQALYVAGREPAPGLVEFLELVRTSVPPFAGGERRRRGEELAQLAHVFTDRAVAGSSDLPVLQEIMQ